MTMRIASLRPSLRRMATSTKRPPQLGLHQTEHHRGLKSLALSVYFKHPDFNMKDYEHLSRSTAFLLAVDPPVKDPTGPFAHLEKADLDRKVRDFKRQHGYSPALGPKPNVQDLGWLQFIPKEHRPNVHVVCSSHVVSPFLWPDYYPQDWLTQVRQEHCKYSLEIFDPDVSEDAIGEYELHNTPIHHPEGRDLALMHIEDEENVLDEMKHKGIEVLHLRDPDKLYQKGEKMYFEGFVVAEPPAQQGADRPKQQPTEPVNEDTRVFSPYNETGILEFHTKDRFFAATPVPLPEGLCGAPAVDADGDLCGIVEGIVPQNHKDPRVAGSAAFLPSFVMAAFVEVAERWIAEQMMPKDIFQSVVRAKATNSLGGGSFKVKDDGTQDREASNWEEAYDHQLEMLKKKYSKEEYDAIIHNIKRERDEVLAILNKEGGDLDDIMHRVRAKTMATREKIMEDYLQGVVSPDDDGKSGEDEKARS